MQLCFVESQSVAVTYISSNTINSIQGWLYDLSEWKIRAYPFFCILVVIEIIHSLHLVP